ncbi:MAG TPA: GAF domain-containing SpoIIE family protein phosphatase [Anaerolineae bacterium]|nr:GAF domain-containing SpoIIE family protein phosphatase [Anaerolineae bacterium]
MIDDNPSPPAADRLSLLYQISQSFNSSLDLDEVLNRVIDGVIATLRAERGFVMLLDDEGEPVFRTARGVDRATIPDPEFQVSRGIVAQVVREARPLLTGDAQAEAEFSLHMSVQALHLRSILCAPLLIHSQVAGVIYVENRLHAGIFTPDDLDLLSTIAASAAIAIENARLYELAVEKGRMERELQMARDLQYSLLPHTTPDVAGWELAAYWQPARQVSGDYYDFCHGGDDRLELIIADVSGKGMPAALFMALTRSIVRATVTGIDRLDDGVARANRLISADSSSGTFVTLFCASLQPGGGDVTYVNAGHNPPLLIKARNAATPPFHELVPTGMALGVLDEARFEQRTVALDVGDLLILYTDGITDAIREDGERFGFDRLRRVAVEARRESASDVLHAIRSAVASFTGVIEQFDDMAIIVARRVPVTA